MAVRLVMKRDEAAVYSTLRLGNLSPPKFPAQSNVIRQEGETFVSLFTCNIDIALYGRELLDRFLSKDSIHYFTIPRLLFLPLPEFVAAGRMRRLRVPSSYAPISRRLFSTTNRRCDVVDLAFHRHDPPDTSTKGPPILLMHGLFGSQRNNRTMSK